MDITACLLIAGQCAETERRLALENRIETVSPEIFQYFDFAVRPANFELIHPIFFAQPKVDAQVILRKIAAAAADLIGLHQLSSCGFYARADGETVLERAGKLQRDPVVGGVVCI